MFVIASAEGYGATLLAAGLVAVMLAIAAIALGRFFRKKDAAAPRWPIILLLVGVTCVVFAYAMQRFMVDLGPYIKTVDGEQHITLTGWDQKDYSILKQYPQVAVLQMANADVTDETLKHLAGMQELKELDLNYTQVTDAGLKDLAALPKLKSLRLRSTKITEAGFAAALGEKTTLLELDVRETPLSSKFGREWKKKVPDRKYQNAPAPAPASGAPPASATEPATSDSK